MTFFSLFAWPSVVAVVALLLFAWGSNDSTKQPVAAFLGLLLAIAVFVARLVFTRPFPYALSGLALDFGTALLIVSFYLKRLDRPSKAQFILGLLLIGVSVVSLNAINLVRSIGADSLSRSSESSDRAIVAEGYLLVELGEDDRIEELSSLLETFGAKSEKAFPRLSLEEDPDLSQVYIITFDGDIGRLKSLLESDTENVDHVAEDLVISHLPPPEMETGERGDIGAFLANDPLIGDQWWMTAIGADDIHRRIQDFTPSRKAIVGVLDSGVDSQHEDMKSTYGSSPATTDENGHGTHCAGIAGAPANNGIGIGSLNWEGRFVEIRGYAVLGKDGAGTSEKLAQGILDATRDGVDVISMSLGAWSPTKPKILVDAVDFALDRGVTVIAAAGNSSEDASQHTPSNIEGVISVAAIDQNGDRARFSNMNTSLSRPLSAPGVGILSLMPGNEYKPLNGTSMATPVVSGTAGILKALDPDLTAEEIFGILFETSSPSRAGDQIGPIIRSNKAVERVLSSSANL